MKCNVCLKEDGSQVLLQYLYNIQCKALRSFAANVEIYAERALEIMMENLRTCHVTFAATIQLITAASESSHGSSFFIQKQQFLLILKFISHR